jgi:hypothetical protein
MPFPRQTVCLMDESLRKAVRRRADDACGYCQMPQAATPLIPFHVEHIVSRQHGGDSSVARRVASAGHPGMGAGETQTGTGGACIHDRHQEPARGGAEGPDSGVAWRGSGQGTVVALFSLRRDVWTEHFCVLEGEILGLTQRGRATVRLLNMNAPRRVELRKEWQRS